MERNIAVIILAAGKGERMKSDIPKVLHPVCGRPMLEYVLDLADSLKIKRQIAVLGHKHEEVKKALRPHVKVVIQKKLLGTGDAVKEGLKALKGFQGTVLVLYADIPLLTKETIKKLLDFHIKNDLSATLLAAQLDKPAGYGRVLRDRFSSISGIAEEKDADDFQKDIKEINTGIICFNKKSLEYALRFIRPNNRKKEYYLTDSIGILYKKGCLMDAVKVSDADEAMGINSREGLAQANKIMRRRINLELMKSGVTIADPDSAFISYGTKIGPDTTIYPFTVIEKNVKIGKHCSVGPFVNLRDGTRIEDGSTVGNFLEIVRSKIGSNTLAKHFGYIGDTHIGKNVNIGAGTVTANFNGKQKNTIIIKDKAFIGSDTVLIAPVKIGKGSVTGAGCVVAKNKNVADGAIVVGIPARPLRKLRGKNG